MNEYDHLPNNQFDDKINSIKSQFFSALDDFKKYYVYYNKNPEVNEFQNYYSNSKGQLQTLSRDIFVTTNDIDKQIEILEAAIKTMMELLKEEKALNDDLTKQLKDVENTHVSSEVLIDESKDTYNIQYYNNMNLIIGVVIVCILLIVIFRSNAASSSAPSNSMLGIYMLGLAGFMIVSSLAYISFGTAAILILCATVFLSISIALIIK